MLTSCVVKILCCLSPLALTALNGVCIAQVTPDGTLPMPTRVELSDNTYTIEQGTQRQSNLFHSFQEFSLSVGQTGYFNNSDQIKNIITRVTGNSISRIEGILKANGSANLFFLNPNGIIFGTQSRLDIGGSFIATTASSIKFADGQEFSSGVATALPLLSMAVPIGLQFGNQAQSIVNESVSLPLNFDDKPSGLMVKNSNRTLALVGGDIFINGGNVNAFGGRIELGAVGENSLVELQAIEQGWQLGYAQTRNFKDIYIKDQGIVNASGSQGTIQLQARDILLSNRGAINNLVAQKDDRITGEVVINAQRELRLVGQDKTPPTEINISAQPETTSNSNKLIINAQFLYLESGAIIAANSFGNGQQQGGKIIVNTSESLTIQGSSPSRDRNSSITTTTLTLGDGGNIEINTKNLNLREGGNINALTLSLGNGGTININASESVNLSGLTNSDNDALNAQITTNASFAGLDIETGSAGQILIKTPRLNVDNNSRISSESNSFSGDAGSILIQGNQIMLRNHAQITTASSSGSGGDIVITAKEFLTLRRESLISAEAQTSALNSAITGGNIDIKTPFIFAVPRENSDIQANALGGTGGNINIRAIAIFGIQQRPAPTPLSDITATGRNEAQAGQINITRPEIDPESALLNQDAEVLDTQGLIVQTCGKGGKFASGEFIITGRGGLPLDPVENVSMPEALPDLGGQPSSTSAIPKTRKTKPPTTIVEAQGWHINAAGELELFATSEAAPRNLPKPCLPEDYQLSYN
jgi:filamentous hemagglutinin family protein